MVAETKQLTMNFNGGMREPWLEHFLGTDVYVKMNKILFKDAHAGQVAKTRLLDRKVEPCSLEYHLYLLDPQIPQYRSKVLVTGHLGPDHDYVSAK